MTEPAVSFVGVWTALIALGVILYVLLDGFDLGVGMLHGFAHDAADRELIMNAITPIWDGNETWLVFCGVALLSAFPLVSRDDLDEGAATIRMRSRRRGGAMIARGRLSCKRIFVVD